MSDIVERLRRAHKHDGLSLPAEAADTIESLRAELAKARNAALEEAAKVADQNIALGRVMPNLIQEIPGAIRALREEE